MNTDSLREVILPISVSIGGCTTEPHTVALHPDNSPLPRTQALLWTPDAVMLSVDGIGRSWISHRALATVLRWAVDGGEREHARRAAEQDVIAAARQRIYSRKTGLPVLRDAVLRLDALNVHMTGETDGTP